MIASQVTFEQMKRYAANNSDLGEATSFLQVEYGISELHACWDGFVHTSDAFNQEFTSRKQVCSEFTYALTEYIDYLGESAYLTVGR
jgi:hypothetical protein